MTITPPDSVDTVCAVTVERKLEISAKTPQTYRIIDVLPFLNGDDQRVAFSHRNKVHPSLIPVPCRTCRTVGCFTNSAICGRFNLMLRHMVAGIRRFGVYPMYIHQRDNWEFFAVLRGKCGALFSETGPATLQQRHLWIFPPETAHGWKGDGPNRCKIVVFHFGKVPPLIEKVARERGFLDSTLSPAQVRRVAEIEMELRAPYGSVTEKSLLFFEKAVIELSLIALADVPSAADAGDVNHPLQQVQACLSWRSVE